MATPGNGNTVPASTKAAILKQAAQSLPKSVIAARNDVSRQTVYRVLREAKAGGK